MDSKTSVGSLDNLVIEDLALGHIKEIKKWSVHEDPLLWEYNISQASGLLLNAWYFERKKSLTTNYYAVRQGPRMIGYFGFRSIDWIKRQAILGIALDPGLTSQGYGSQVMKLLLDFYFFDKHMRKLKLEVNNFNLRAIRLYEKFGFKKVADSLISFPIEDKDLEIFNNPAYFTYKAGKLFSKTSKMELERQTYCEIWT